jgi:gliding motility-associated-like protein
LNIDGGNSVFVVFALQTTLRISAAVAPNNSVRFTNIPLQDACIFQPWIHTPGAVDEDGDSLAYRLVPSMGTGCETFPLGFYEYPTAIGAIGPSPNPLNTLEIDPATGIITWEVPQRVGEYNIAFVVEEWRNGLLIGTVLRDMQIQVDQCDNVAPEIVESADTCIEAGNELLIPVEATDPDGNLMTVSGFGIPFEVASSPAFIDNSGGVPPVQANFIWNTNCSHVRLAPYEVTVQVQDEVNDNASLVDATSFSITVVAPAPENLEAEAIGSAIELNWDPSPCTEAIGYKIYRRIDPFGFVPSFCETGVPEYTGYTLIDTVSGLNNTNFTDDAEVIFGRQTCYMVVACFADGAESYASNEACAEIRFEIPIIKKNSVGITAQAGVDTVFWRSPIELDETVFPGPYRYRLLRSEGYGEADELVFETEEFPSFDNLPSSFTSFTSENLNTEDTAHTYRVELYSEGEFAARSNLASSLFIELTPDDNSVSINWREEVPWINFRYDVYRRGEGQTDFEFIGSTDTIGYRDTGLVNNDEYCYYIVSHGSYFAVEESDTLINFSQQTCAMPYDRTPPCAPVLNAEGDCVELFVDLEWTNPNLECAETDDVLDYNIYFKPTEEAEFELLATVSGPETNDFFLDFLEENSIAGCYAVTALDSLSLWPDGELRRNESELSNVICFDNCPEYTLPNVFTPNGDGRNDFFMPFPYRSVDSIALTVFTRWGSIVFQSTDPDILWNGTNPETGNVVSDGTYYYTCRVFTIQLSGLEPVDLSGYVTIFGDNANTLD